MGHGFLLPGVGSQVGDVMSVSRIDDIAAAHDIQHKQPHDGCFESTLMIWMACRVDWKRILGFRSSIRSPDLDSDISSVFFVFFCSHCARDVTVSYFYFCDCFVVVS